VKRHFFDIPIYRCPIEVHTVEMAKAKKKYLDYYKRPQINASKDQLAAFGHRWDAESWSSWHFNEVIGWVRLYVRWDEIMGDLWEITAPHPQLGTKKVFKCGGDYFKLRPEKDASSAEISDLLRGRVQYIQKLPRMKKRHFDFEEFDEIRRFVDWRALIDSNKKSE
jgi:hypothetical protein